MDEQAWDMFQEPGGILDEVETQVEMGEKGKISNPQMIIPRDYYNKLIELVKIM